MKNPDQRPLSGPIVHEETTQPFFPEGYKMRVEGVGIITVKEVRPTYQYVVSLVPEGGSPARDITISAEEFFALEAESSVGRPIELVKIEPGYVVRFKEATTEEEAGLFEVKGADSDNVYIYDPQTASDQVVPREKLELAFDVNGLPKLASDTFKISHVGAGLGLDALISTENTREEALRLRAEQERIAIEKARLAEDSERLADKILDIKRKQVPIKSPKSSDEILDEKLWGDVKDEMGNLGDSKNK